MPFTKLNNGLLHTTLICIATSASAGLTGMDVWRDLQAHTASAGFELTGAETASQTGLLVENITLNLGAPTEEFGVEIQLPKLSFDQKSDGSVAIRPPQFAVIKVQEDTASADILEIEVEVTSDALDITVTGEPKATQYRYGADRLELLVADVSVTGEEADSLYADAKLELDGLSGHVNVTTDADRSTVHSLSLNDAEWTMSLGEQSPGDLMVQSGSLQNLAYAARILIPLIRGKNKDLWSLLAAGMETEIEYSYDSARFSLGSSLGGLLNSLDLATAETSFRSTKTSERTTLNGTSHGLTITVALAPLRSPLTFYSTENDIELSYPLQSTEEAVDFSLTTRITDVVSTDAFWGLFDPAGVLPRSPANIELDLSGQARLLVDLVDLDLETLASQQGFVLANIERLDINRLLISAVGGELFGKGAFEIGELGPDMRPTGSAAFRLSGSQTLLDRLVRTGLLSQQNAMGARLMLGLFAKPTEDKDVVTSTIEMNEHGHVLANGQRIQ